MNKSMQDANPLKIEPIDYILFTGAPGSRWSSVANSIYYSPDVDRSDSAMSRKYVHHNGLVHEGTYFDPGMEYGNERENWDKPFSGHGKRIIKSHTFAYSMPIGYPTVICLRNAYECYTWWMECGGWDITYPNYSWYQPDIKFHISKMVDAATRFLDSHDSVRVYDSNELASALEIIPAQKVLNFIERDVDVYVCK